MPGFLVSPEASVFKCSRGVKRDHFSSFVLSSGKYKKHSVLRLDGAEAPSGSVPHVVAQKDDVVWGEKRTVRWISAAREADASVSSDLRWWWWPDASLGFCPHTRRNPVFPPQESSTWKESDWLHNRRTKKTPHKTMKFRRFKTRKKKRMISNLSPVTKLSRNINSFLFLRRFYAIQSKKNLII